MPDIKINITNPTAATTPATPAAPAINIKSAGPAITIAGPNVGTPQSGPNIFTQQQTKTEAPKMLTSIVSNKTDSASKLKPILGNAATLQKTLEQEKEYRLKKKLKLLQVTFVGVFLISILSALYFYTELSPSFNLFGANTTAKLTETNKNLRGLQAKINKYRYLAAQQDLNQFSILADQFMDKTSKLTDPTASLTNKTQIASDVTKLKTDIPTVLQRIKSSLGESIIVPTVLSAAEPVVSDAEIQVQFETDLRTALAEERAALVQKSTGAENAADLRLYDNAMQLVGNQSLLGAIASLNIETLKTDLDDFAAKPDAAKRKGLQTKFSTILSTTRGDISSIASIKSQRINWSAIISQIDTVTKEVDKYFGQGLYITYGGIIYSGYEFETASGKIVLSGMTRTNDGNNFTLLSELIDHMEEADYFKNVEMRSFSKSGEPGEGFIASFKLQLDLETDGGASSKNKPVALTRKALMEKMGAKRLGTVTPASSN